MYLKISAGFVASIMQVMMLSCSGKHSEQQTPMASRMSDSVKVAWQQPQEAVLRIHLESARPTDMLTEVAVRGAGIAQDVSVTAISKLMTHPFERDFAIEPCEGQTDVMVTATVGGETVQTRTLVPHLLKGTRTQLNLYLERGHMRIVSSWITETTEGAMAYRASEDSIGKGFFLHGDGIVTREKGRMPLPSSLRRTEDMARRLPCRMSKACGSIQEAEPLQEHIMRPLTARGRRVLYITVK